MAISVEDYQLLEFFGVEPQLADRHLPWTYNDATYHVQVADIATTFTVSPSYGDVTLNVHRGAEEMVHFSARRVDDIRIVADANYEALQIDLGKNGQVTVRLRPTFELRQRWSAPVR